MTQQRALILLHPGFEEMEAVAPIDYTAHPSTRAELGAARLDSVVIDGAIITSRGAGTATEFALAIVERLCGLDCAREIAESICWPHTL